MIRRVGPGVSANQIAKEAGVTKPIIYRHFGDIQELYHALAVRHERRLADWLQRARDRAEGQARQARFRAVVDAFFYAIRREPNIFRFLVLTGGDQPERAGATSWFTRIFAAEIAGHLAAITGQPGDAARPRAMGFGMTGALLAAGNWWLEEPATPIDDVVDALTDLLLRGLPQQIDEPG